MGATIKIAVFGATGTAGARTVTLLTERGISVVQGSRSTGVHRITGEGVEEMLEDVDVVTDTSNAFPPDESISLHEALTTATRKVVAACAARRVGHLVFLSVYGSTTPRSTTSVTSWPRATRRGSWLAEGRFRCRW